MAVRGTIQNFLVSATRSEGIKKDTDINTNRNIERNRYIIFLYINTPY
jgi:hypothetical protein